MVIWLQQLLRDIKVNFLRHEQTKIRRKQIFLTCLVEQGCYQDLITLGFQSTALGEPLCPGRNKHSRLKTKKDIIATAFNNWLYKLGPCYKYLKLDLFSWSLVPCYIHPGRVHGWSHTAGDSFQQTTHRCPDCFSSLQQRTWKLFRGKIVQAEFKNTLQL